MRTLLLAASLIAAGSIPLDAQYVGRVDTTQDNNTPTLRATAVLEYTGDLAHPTASRLVPIAVWDGERYQPGGLYLAQPVPLTVEAGTQYVLQVAGIPKEFFDVNAASDVNGSWIAIGTFEKPTPVKVAKLRPSRIPPHVVSADDDKPHFAHVPAGDTSTPSTSTGPKTAQSDTSDVDPDRPTLHHRTDTTPGQNTPANTSSTTASTSAPAASTDPDRPILHEATAASNDNGAPVTASNVVDPDRPRLGYGRPKDLESLDAASAVQTKKLTSAGDNLEQIAAVSDAATRRPHSYVYSWLDQADETKVRSSIETLAQQLLAKPAQNASIGATKPHTVTRTATKSTTARRRTVKPALPPLADEKFTAYELSFGGGATLVFSASSGQGDAERYITLIAQPDFNGTPIVLFKQITSQHDLDVVPRMKLIDAVDTDADNRAELIFALENKTGRQYAIYRVADNKVEKVFATGS